MHTQKKNQRGFTLIEILIVIGLIAVLAAIVLIAINPARQFAQGRDTQRNSHLNTILNAVGQRMADNKGVFEGANLANGKNCTAIPETSSPTTTIGTAGFDLDCLVPTYIPSIPMDPNGGTAANTGYGIRKDSNGRIWVVASSTEPTIPRNTDLYIVR